MKCTKCGIDKPQEAFNVRKERGQPYRQCRECMAVKSKRWFEANRERNAALSRKWASANPERARGVWREMKRKQREDPLRRFSMNVRTAVANSLSGRKTSRGTFSAIGYSKEELMAHLERQFLRGMTWENYGEWHVDHIVPLASFDICGTDSDGFRSAWALTNLRPLWGRDNVRKQAKAIYLI